MRRDEHVAGEVLDALDELPAGVAVGGGNGKGVRVELRDAASGEVLRTATGDRSVVLRTVEWPIADLRGRTVRLACVDEEKGPWGVLFVDDVRESQ